MMKVRGKLPFVFLISILQVASADRRLGASSKVCLGKNCVRASVGTSSRDCLGGDTLLFSCSAGTYVPARDIETGDSVRTIGHADGLPTCSEVYYTFKHRGLSSALSIEVRDATLKDDDNDNDTYDTFVVSPHHLVYVGSSFDTRRPVMAKNLSPGDVLVSHDGEQANAANRTGVVVSSIEPVNVDLVNVLTVEPALELSNGVVISAHSYHEVLYSYIFWPFRLVYGLIGKRVDNMLPALDRVDTFVVRPMASLFSEL